MVNRRQCDANRTTPLTTLMDKLCIHICSVCFYFSKHATSSEHNIIIRELHFFESNVSEKLKVVILLICTILVTGKPSDKSLTQSDKQTAAFQCPQAKISGWTHIWTVSAHQTQTLHTVSIYSYILRILKQWLGVNINNLSLCCSKFGNFCCKKLCRYSGIPPTPCRGSSLSTWVNRTQN